MTDKNRAIETVMSNSKLITTNMCPGLIPRLGMLWIESMAFIFFHLSS